MTTGNPRYGLPMLNVTKITFELLSREYVHRLSENRVITRKDLLLNAGPESLYDRRMGPIDDVTPCATCKQQLRNCPGHFGRIQLALPVVMPLLAKEFTHLLSAFCNAQIDDPERPGRKRLCMCPLITKSQMEPFTNLDATRKWRHTTSIPARTCRRRHTLQGAWVYYTEKDVARPGAGPDPFRLIVRRKGEDDQIVNPAKVQRWLATEGTSEYMAELGLGKLGEHNAEQLVMRDLLVLPNPYRPPTTSESGTGTIHADLTHIYAKIVGKNEELKAKLRDVLGGANLHLLQEPWRDECDPLFSTDKTIVPLYVELCSLMRSFYNNKDGACRAENSSKGYKGVVETIDGKEGIIRQEIFAGRTNNTARTVIVSTPDLDTDEVGIPEDIANKLVTAMVVTEYNVDVVKELWKMGKVTSIKSGPDRAQRSVNCVDTGTTQNIPVQVQALRAIMEEYRIENDGEEPGLSYLVEKMELESDELNRLLEQDQELRDAEDARTSKVAACIQGIQPGDVVERHLIDGDFVMISRQPILWKYSMSVMRIKIVKGKAILIPDGSNQQFNADHDGDEMNVYVPQGVNQQADALRLMSFTFNVLSEQGSRPLYGLIQDALISSMLLTSTIMVNTSTDEVVVVGGLETTRPKVTRIVVDAVPEMKRSLWDACISVAKREHMIPSLLERCKRFGINPYSGRGLFSILFREDFTYTGRSPDKKPLVIVSGVLLKGTLSQGSMNTAQNTIHHELCLRYGPREAVRFLSDARRLCHHWLESYGLTLGYKDLALSKAAQADIERVKQGLLEEVIRTQRAGEKARGALAQTVEADVLRGSNNIMDQLSGVVIRHLVAHQNTFLMMAMSGSKGSATSITQMLGIVGQITIQQERPANVLSDRRRSDLHYPVDDPNPESRGMCATSYVQGLGPSAVLYQGMAVHQAQFDIAVHTGDTGYMQRKLVMFQIHLTSQENGSVTGSDGTIIQYRYGGDGLNRNRVVNVGGKSRFINVDSVVDAVKLELALARVKGVTLPEATKVFVNGYQAAKIVATRADALQRGAAPYLPVTRDMPLSAVMIANAELEEGLIPGITLPTRLATGEMKDVVLERTVMVESDVNNGL
jgi:DNA-directed RNA polymerase beta' subunit